MWLKFQVFLASLDYESDQFDAHAYISSSLNKRVNVL